MHRLAPAPRFPPACAVGTRSSPAQAYCPHDDCPASPPEVGDAHDRRSHWTRPATAVVDPLAAAFALARRFAAGATMWCLAPEWPEHARHVAVEFVHPVIIGKRALPAVGVESTTGGVAARPRAPRRRPVVGNSRRRLAGARRGMRRGRAWGTDHDLDRRAATRPRPGRPTTSLGSTTPCDAGDERRHDGRLVLRYHVLWELAHVCFEHPGLLTTPRAACDVDGRASPAPTRARLGEVITDRRRGSAPRAHGRGIETIDTSSSAAVAARRPRARARRHRHRRRGRSGDMSEAHRLPVPVHRGRRARPRSAARRPRRVGASPRRRRAPRSGRRRSTASAPSITPAAAAMAGGSRRAGGCSRSGTAEAPPTPRRWRPCSPVRRGDVRSPARCLVDDSAVLTALANDVGFDLVFSRQLIAHADAATSRSACRRAATRATCSWRSPKPQRGLLTIGLAGYEGGEMARVGDVQHCLVVRHDSVHRVRRRRRRSGFAPVATRCRRRPRRGRRSRLTRGATIARPRCSTASPSSGGAGRACATTWSRSRTVPAARRRRRSSTRCSSKRSPTGPPAPLADAATLRSDGRAPRVQHRLVRRAAAPVSRRLDRPPRRARHRERPRGPGRQPAWLSAAFVIEEGFPSPSCARSPATWPRPRPSRGADRHRRHQGRRARAPPTGCSSRRPASA